MVQEQSHSQRYDRQFRIKKWFLEKAACWPPAVWSAKMVDCDRLDSVLFSCWAGSHSGTPACLLLAPTATFEPHLACPSLSAWILALEHVAVLR